MLILGLSLPPGITVPGASGPSVPRELHATQCKTHRPEVQPHNTVKGERGLRGDSGGICRILSTGRPRSCLFLPDCSMCLFWPGPAKRPQQTKSKNSDFLFLSGHFPPNPCPFLFWTRPLSGLKIAPHHLLDGIPKAAHAQKKCLPPCLQEMPSAKRCAVLPVPPTYPGPLGRHRQRAPAPSPGLTGSSSQPQT